MSVDKAIIEGLFTEAGASTLLWEQGRRCTCYTADSRQPSWDCPKCSGYGVVYSPLAFPRDGDPPVFDAGLQAQVLGLRFPDDGSGLTLYAPTPITGLFRSQSRWINPRAEGEFGHGEASLTLPIEYKPNYVDRRVRDRFTVLNAQGDPQDGRVFYPAAAPVPFMFFDEHVAWRVQLQSLEQINRVREQP